jgi:LAO/AO transport system kinase
VTYSALHGSGIEDIWARVLEHRARMQACGEFDAKRREQQVKWMWTMLEERLMRRLHEDESIAARLSMLEAAVARGDLSPRLAVNELAGALGLSE